MYVVWDAIIVDNNIMSQAFVVIRRPSSLSSVGAKQQQQQQQQQQNSLLINNRRKNCNSMIRKITSKTSSSNTQLYGVIDIVGISPEPIHTAFAYATFGPQPFWLLMILLPKSDITKKVMGPMGT
jgi:hypothetical protein